MVVQFSVTALYQAGWRGEGVRLREVLLEQGARGRPGACRDGRGRPAPRGSSVRRRTTSRSSATTYTSSNCRKKPSTAEYDSRFSFRVSIDTAIGGAPSKSQLRIVCAKSVGPQ